MKYVGCTTYMAEERDADIMRTYDRIVSDPSMTSIRDIYVAVANSPAKQFWITPRRAYDMVKRIHYGHGIPLRTFKLRRAMYEEIYRRALELTEKNQSLRLYDAVSMVVYRSAPSFYMSPMTIKNIITSKLRKKR